MYSRESQAAPPRLELTFFLLRDWPSNNNRKSRGDLLTFEIVRSLLKEESVKVSIDGEISRKTIYETREKGRFDFEAIESAFELDESIGPI